MKVIIIYVAVYASLALYGHCQHLTAYFNSSLSPSLTLPSTVLQFQRRLQFSFRTCYNGTLLFQQNADGTNSVHVAITNPNALMWTFRHDNNEDIVSMHADKNLINNEWYSLDSQFITGEIVILIEQGPSVISRTLVSNSTHRTYLWDLDLSGGVGLQVGGSDFSGCIQRGIGLPLDSPDASATNIEWDTCPLEDREYAGCEAEAPDPCWLYPCSNRGTCVRNGSDYTCICPVPFSGRNCESDLRNGGCDVNLCRNGGTCTENEAGDTFTCQCVPGYTGPLCDVNIDECQSHPCRNGGACADGVNTYMCDCAGTGYRGLVCEVNINECDELSPCNNSAVCLDTPGSYKCDCPAGLGGQNCDVVVDECTSTPCQNGGECIDSTAMYTCLCVMGFTGVNCETNIDDCLGVTCDVEFSQCVDHVASYTCACQPGYYDPANPAGDVAVCQEIDECESAPCRNGATCSNLIDSYECICTPGYTGTLCEQNINECASQPCQNDARCEDGVASFTCECRPGYTGDTCESDIDDCAAEPCVNGATCLDLIDEYDCVCVAGWTGVHCEVQVNECGSGPCENGGTCEDQQNSYLCTCALGFTGLNCEININDCADSPCQNGGTCIDGVNEYTCNCTDEWMGQDCTEVYDACSFTPCENGATCSSVPPSHDYSCACADGFTDERCQVNIDDCVPGACADYEVCVDGVNDFTCACPMGFEGDECEVEIDECASNPCLNNGTCIDHVGYYECVCLQATANLTAYSGNPASIYTLGFEGEQCEINIDECAYSPPICQNGATCTDENSTDFFFCSCRNFQNYYAGRYCEVGFDNCKLELIKVPDPPVCQNEGECRDTGSSFACDCAPGWEGRRCKVNIDECESMPCQYNGTCTDLVNGYHCDCIEGLTGSNCEININECESNPCQNNGSCIDEINGYVCNCTDTGFKGTLCEINIDECESDPCQNAAPCVDLIKEYVCECLPGFTSQNCETDINECESSPCMNDATCLERSRNEDFNITEAEGYDCMCEPGYTGIHCETDIDECASMPCVFGACVDDVNGYMCTCQAGYTGTHCETEIDECTLLAPCQNEAGCVDLVADYRCLCTPQYGGKNCTVELIGCIDNGCQNNALCVPFYSRGQHDYTCQCPPGFYGRHCEDLTSATFKHGAYMIYDLTSGVTDLDLQLSFRTTLANGVLVFNLANQNNNYLLLSLKGGNMLEFIYDTSLTMKVLQLQTDNETNLNDAAWHTVKVVVQSSGLNLTLEHPDCMEQGQQGRCEQSAVFQDASMLHTLSSTYLSYEATDDPDQITLLQSQPGYVGCMRDVIINNEWIVPQERKDNGMATVEVSCPRTDPCSAVPCGGRGECQDQWYRAACVCHRPYRGQTCELSFTAGTFGLEGENSLASFTIPEAQKEALRESVELSLFVRTTNGHGLVFYIGGDSSDNPETYIAGHLTDGLLYVELNIDGTIQTIAGPQVKLDDAEQHSVTVNWEDDSLQIHIDDQTKQVSVSNLNGLNPKHLYFGGLPSSSTQATRKRRQVGNVPEFQLSSGNFVGTIQDIRLNEHLLHLHALNATVGEDWLPEYALPVTSNMEDGEVSEDVCALQSPCDNNATCSVVFYNDFHCECPEGFKGKRCDELDWCLNTECPEDALCVDLLDGFECVTNATFDGSATYTQYRSSLLNVTRFDSVSIEFRTRDLQGILLHILSSLTNGDDNQFMTFALTDGVLTLKCDMGSGVIERELTNVADGDWHMIILRLDTDRIIITLDGPTGTAYTINTTPSSTNMYDYINSTNQIYLGGAPPAYDSKYLLHSQAESYFKGCMGEVRIGPVLLPFFEQSDYVNQSTRNYFEAITLDNIQIGCQGDPVCDSNECVNNSTCVDEWNFYSCDCVLGFDGRFCEYNINDCEGHACLNGATCVDGIAEYSCTCRPGYMGERCETDIDECASGPCYNGSCIDGENGFTCNCTEEYVGLLCEISRTDNCAHDPCMNGASCENVTTIYEDILTFECACLPGYTGRYCETEIDFCEQVTCLNGATCVSLTSEETFTCECVPGYTGELCETDIDECAVGPCANNGTCTDLVNAFSCSCAPGWTGSTCAEDINECEMDPFYCDNGMCINLPGDVFCNCEGSGFRGPKCSVDIDECEEGYCKNGAECENYNGTYSCNCTLGYEGENCDIANCTFDQCLNGATCDVITDTDDVEQWQCTCIEYYEGDQCEFEGACLEMPCENGATCVQEDGDYENYTCVCAPGWEGMNCSMDINECDANPCMNGATCNNLDGSYECACAEGYTGLHCETDIDECAAQPCVNGVCENLPGDFQCDCADTGYEGELCADDINECALNPPVCMNGATCHNLEPFFNCTCMPGYVGDVCHSMDPCYDGTFCENGATCDTLVDDVTQNVTSKCTCTDDWEGPRCDKAVPGSGEEGASKGDDNQDNMIIIIGVVIGALVLIIVVVIVLVCVALRIKEKRATRGTYSPSRQEMSGSRIDVDNQLKIPPPERLI